MLSNIYDKAIRPLQDIGGIIICHTGSLHAHRLAAHLRAKYNITSIIALNCYSDEHVNQISNDFVTQNRFKIKIDSSAIRQTYEEVPYIELHFEVNNNEFYNKKFDEIITSHINIRKTHQMVSDHISTKFAFQSNLSLFSRHKICGAPHQNAQEWEKINCSHFRRKK